MIASPPLLDLDQPGRPMLARDADSIYWMSRYVERAEHVARLLVVTSSLLTDVGELAPNLQHRQWRSILEIMRLDELPPSREGLATRIMHHMTFDPANPSGLFNCLTRARENARSIRENISNEMWECINQLYWSIRGDDAPACFADSPDELLRSIVNGSMLFQGLTDQTLPHDQRWLFTQLAKYFERIDVTCRVIETKFNILRSVESKLEPALRNIHWTGVLRCCGAAESFRRAFVGEIEPARVVSFLVLLKDFPRGIRFCAERAHAAAAAIRGGIGTSTIDPAERILGRLSAQLQYAQIDDIIAGGLPDYLKKIQSDIAEASRAVQQAYFLH
jgi:uncharacterized alpha-E superfamily protein